MWTRFYLGILSFQSTLPAGGATDFYWPALANIGISIHAPRGGSDRTKPASLGPLEDFNPRSPRGERRLWSRASGDVTPKYFNPRSPRGERRAIQLYLVANLRISIHAPRGGSDQTSDTFLARIIISIHAPRGGSDPAG